jgi:hypothetical protein
VLLLLLFAFIKFALRPPGRKVIEKETPKGFGLTVFKETTINYNVGRRASGGGEYWDICWIESVEAQICDSYSEVRACRRSAGKFCFCLRLYTLLPLPPINTELCTNL